LYCGCQLEDTLSHDLQKSEDADGEGTSRNKKELKIRNDRAGLLGDAVNLHSYGCDRKPLVLSRHYVVVSTREAGVESRSWL
jgi:hypothetical protein